MEKLLVALVLATAGIGLFVVLITVLLLHVHSSLDTLIQYEVLKEAHWQQDQQTAHDHLQHLISRDSPATRVTPTLRVVSGGEDPQKSCATCWHLLLNHTVRNRGACEVPGCSCAIFHLPDGD